MTALLDVGVVTAGYDDATVLHEVSLDVAEGEIVAIVGANGAGKSTLLRAISGLIPCRSGAVRFAGVDLTRLPAHAMVSHGLIMVPEGGKLFGGMTVRENLELGAFASQARPAMKRSMDAAFARFPILAQRRHQLAGSLSGGERTMCAIARALMSRPRLLMLDEPSLGLSPQMAERMFDMVADLARTGISMLIVEQNIGAALEMSARAYVLAQGRVVRSGASSTLLADEDIRHAYLGH